VLGSECGGGGGGSRRKSAPGIAAWYITAIWADTDCSTGRDVKRVTRAAAEQ
jgi:hypothetical protein